MNLNDDSKTGEWICFCNILNILEKSSYIWFIGNRKENINKAFQNYLKAYDIMDEIEEKQLVNKREFDLMKARISLNCGNYKYFC
jgi:hypothetical protein